MGDGCAEVAGATQGLAALEACCDTCGGKDVLGDEAPQPACPCDDCDCQTCVCHGATVDGDSVLADLSSVGKVWLAVESYERFSKPRLTSLRVAGQIPQSSPFVSGRAARIGLQSFQI